MDHIQHSRGAKIHAFRLKWGDCEVAGEKGSEMNQSKAAGLGGQLAERTCHQPIGHACVLHQQVYKYVSCFTLHVRRDGNPDGILNAVFHVLSFSRLVHPSLVCHLVPSQSVNTPDLPARSLHYSQCALPSTSLMLKKEAIRVSLETKLQAWSQNYKNLQLWWSRRSQSDITVHARETAELKKKKKTCAKYSSKSNKWASLYRLSVTYRLHLKSTNCSLDECFVVFHFPDGFFRKGRKWKNPRLDPLFADSLPFPPSLRWFCLPQIFKDVFFFFFF